VSWPDCPPAGFSPTLLILAGVLAGARQRAPAAAGGLDVSINSVPHSQSLVLIDGSQVWIDLEALTSAGVSSAAIAGPGRTTRS
jgi:hypothetical protein